MNQTEALRDNSPHVCTAIDCPQFARYYVTAIDAGTTYFMSGPYTTHAAALADVDKALRLANEHDGRAWFMSWGTVKLKDYSYDKPGSLNRAGLLTIPA